MGGTRAMATTSMTMTVATMIIMRTIMATMTIMRKTMVTKIAMDMVTKGTVTTITVMKILTVLGESTDGTGVTVTITVPSTDLVEATSHSWASIISSILKASKDLSLTPYRIQSVPTKDPLLTLYRIQAPPIKHPGLRQFAMVASVPSKDPGSLPCPNTLLKDPGIR